LADTTLYQLSTGQERCRQQLQNTKKTKLSVKPCRHSAPGLSTAPVIKAVDSSVQLLTVRVKNLEFLKYFQTIFVQIKGYFMQVVFH